MNFREYITESQSMQMLAMMGKAMIPISPKFFEDVFKPDKMFCFVAIEPQRMESIYRRQHERKTISTFTEWTNTNIFWGASGMEWKDNMNGNTIIAVIKGKPSIKLPTDAWSDYTDAGRRWLDIGAIVRNTKNKDIKKIFNSMYKEIKKKYAFIDHKSTGKERREYIKGYIDYTYDLLKKYKNDLAKAYQDIDKYDEVLCYDYDLVQFIILDKTGDFEYHLTSDNFLGTSDVLAKVPYSVVKSARSLSSELRKYKKKNKGK